MSLSKEVEMSVKEAVKERFAALIEAANSLDPDRYFQFIDADKFVGLGSDGKIWQSAAELQELIVAGFATIEKVKSLEFSKVAISVIDEENAVLVNEYEQVSLLKDGSEYSELGGGVQVWSRGTGDWKLVSIASSSK